MNRCNRRNKKLAATMAAVCLVSAGCRLGEQFEEPSGTEHDTTTDPIYDASVYDGGWGALCPEVDRPPDTDTRQDSETGTPDTDTPLDSETETSDTGGDMDAGLVDGGQTFARADVREGTATRATYYDFNNTESPYLGGDVSVDLVVVDYSNFGCSHCADFARDWEELWTRRPDIRDRVRFIFHHYPFSDATSWDLHKASVAAGKQGMSAFWQLHDYIYGERVDTGHLPDIDDVRAFCADVLHLDMEAFEADFADPKTAEFVAWDKLQASSQGISNTPSVFICGEKISRSKLESIIDGYLNP